MHKLIAKLHRRSLTPFRAILLDRKTELLEADALNAERSTELQAQETDLDKARHIAFRAMRVNRVLSGKLQRIKEALERIDSGTFGTCIHCEEFISSDRLQAVPWERVCVACKGDTTLIPSEERNVIFA